jgi:hypothetical protein
LKPGKGNGSFTGNRTRISASPGVQHVLTFIEAKSVRYLTTLSIATKCVLDESNMRMERWWNDTDRGKW